VVLRGRGGGDVIGTYPEVAAALGRAAGRRTVILDGEIMVFDGDRPSFAMLQRRMHVARLTPALAAAVPVTYVAFDLLWPARALAHATATSVWRASSSNGFPLRSSPGSAEAIG
jgi:hypothetical protein